MAHPKLPPDGCVVDVVDGQLRVTPATPGELSQPGITRHVGGYVELLLTTRSLRRKGVALGVVANRHNETLPVNCLIEVGAGSYLEVRGPARWMAMEPARGEWIALTPDEASDIRSLYPLGARAVIVQVRGLTPVWPVDD